MESAPLNALNIVVHEAEEGESGEVDVDDVFHHCCILATPYITYDFTKGERLDFPFRDALNPGADFLQIPLI
jgi:hypothetical protein